MGHFGSYSAIVSASETQMPDISISTEALDKLFRTFDALVGVGRADSSGAIPALLWASRCYSTTAAGETIEHGAGFYMHCAESVDDRMVFVETARGRVGVGPTRLFGQGVHHIFFIDGRFGWLSE
ncbi:hypothetical protein A1351_21215 [Methylosinus sp. R-45379]|nr:hypothetical protein A1351_21215 [Methylosinus sp. R-45379]